MDYINCGIIFPYPAAVIHIYYIISVQKMSIYMEPIVATWN